MRIRQLWEERQVKVIVRDKGQVQRPRDGAEDGHGGTEGKGRCNECGGKGEKRLERKARPPSSS